MNSPTFLSQASNKKPLKGRPLQANADQYRQQLLTNALTVFLEKGYAGSSIEGIARHAKVSKNTIYLQFGSKENLFQEAARFGVNKAHTQLNLSIDKNIPFEAALLSIIELIQTLTADTNLRNLTRLLIAEAQRFPDIASVLFADFQQMVKPMTNYLQQASQANDLAIGDPSEAAFDLTMLALGGFNFLLSEPETSKTLNKKRALKLRDLFLKGWQKKT